MAIRKVKGLESEFSILPNNVINDSLSWAARGLLAYLLSKPADWRVSITALINETEGSKKHTKRDGVYSLIDELIEAGYIKRDRTSGQGYSKTEYTVSYEKTKPLTDYPDQVQPEQDNPDQVEPTLQSKDLLESTEEEKAQSNTNSPVGKKPTRTRLVKPEAFKEFYRLYPEDRRGGSDQTVWEKWKKMRLTQEDAEQALAWLIEANKVPGWSASRFVPGITKFVSEKRWLTPLPKPEHYSDQAAPVNQMHNGFESRDYGQTTTAGWMNE